MTDTNAKSSYLKFLPAIFSEDPLLGEYLLAFEQVLTGFEKDKTKSDPKQGLEQIIHKIFQLFDPNDVEYFFLPDSQLDNQQTTKDFLQWLASWTALSLRADWSPKQQKEFLSQIVYFYRSRGTKSNLEKFLAIYTGLKPVIKEPEDNPFQVGVSSIVGKAQVGEGNPNYFEVDIRINRPNNPDDLQRQNLIINSLIDLQKPAHTDYKVIFLAKTMQINEQLQIGVNTFLGKDES
ncbi:phage tail protein [Nodularia spumigena CS-590/02]|uniref:phage tail protein n=1 Tax=Nodularia spumigena TaxID=70799 RepID=UPI00232B4AC4|nr:phage tail protein [Nodularia spumigena]MDB9326731.1 phage tail protein [Nodularia spumigena CS-590/02]